MVLGNVEETVTTTEVDEETLEEIVRVGAETQSNSVVQSDKTATAMLIPRCVLFVYAVS